MEKDTQVGPGPILEKGFIINWMGQDLRTISKIAVDRGNDYSEWLSAGI
jgi:hypothetical protein